MKLEYENIFYHRYIWFLGRNVTIELLKQKDIQIVGFVLPNEKNLEFYEQHKNIVLIRGNILSKEDVNNFLSYECGDVDNVYARVRKANGELRLV